MDVVVIAGITGGVVAALAAVTTHWHLRKDALREKRLADAFYRARTCRMHGASLAPNLYVNPAP